MDRVDRMQLFALVARHGSFTGAAEEIGKPVQTVSKGVRQLEEQLGVLLFDRTTRSVALTDTGRAYLDRVQDLVEQFDELESDVRAQHDSPQGRIRLTAPTSFGEKRLVPVIAEFLATYPEIQLEMMLTNSRVSLVDEGIDLAIRIGSLRDSSLIAKRLADMRVVAVASPQYLEQWGRPSAPAELERFPCVIDTNFANPDSWPFLTEKLSKDVERVAVQGRVRANSPEANRQMALAGVGIAMCPMYVVNQDIVAGKLLPLFEELEAREFGVYALYPHRRHLSTRVRVLVEFLQARFRQL